MNAFHSFSFCHSIPDRHLKYQFVITATRSFFGGFTADEIQRLMRRAAYVPADFWRKKIRRRIRRAAPAEGSNSRARS